MCSYTSIEIWKSNVFEFDLTELYLCLIPKCVFEPNPGQNHYQIILVRNSGSPGLPELLSGYYKNKSPIGDSSSSVVYHKIWITESLHTGAGEVSEYSVVPLGFKNKLYLINHFKDIIGEMGPVSINYPINLLYTLEG